MPSSPISAAEDMEAIRQVLAAYAINGDRLRLEALADTFTEDGVLETPTAVYSGHEDIRAGLGGGRASRPPAAPIHTFTRHNLTTSNIALTGPDSAAGRTYFMVMTDAGLDHTGFYDDDLVRLDGRWLFSRRRVRIDWISDTTVLPALLAAHRRRQALRAGAQST